MPGRALVRCVAKFSTVDTEQWSFIIRMKEGININQFYKKLTKIKYRKIKKLLILVMKK